MAEDISYKVKKKSNELGIVAGPKTQQQLDWNINNEQGIDLPDLFGKETLLYLTWVHNRNNPLEPRIFLICPDGDKPLRQIELFKKTAGGVIDISQPSESGTESVPKRVNAKKASRKKKGNEHKKE